ncbi:hypothetical protein P3T36_003909 [Kitasatospora sp. MAP12-15]|uniref:hypothetical protein n=1 Tax=unclassified Kitasatospora TaxID=2633591 RepID=UPI0024747230|nr:hypothetical protein [Kitasatospora sp. MAP12-44]MDH6108447.1 hypothetical protein [Kitasatospora sp. MAP12-44]
MATSQPAPPATRQGPLGPAATVTVIALLVVFLAALVVLGVMRGDKNWDRLIYLLSGLEAVVFAGAGALFGTTVQRAQVVDAKQEAVAALERADASEGDALAGRVLHRGVMERAQERAAARQPFSAGIRAGRPTASAMAGTRTAETDLADLARLARTLFPDR